MEKLPLQDQGPPEEVTEAGVFLHPCEGEAVCKLTNEKARCSPTSLSRTWTAGRCVQHVSRKQSDGDMLMCRCHTSMRLSSCKTRHR